MTKVIIVNSQLIPDQDCMPCRNLAATQQEKTTDMFGSFTHILHIKGMLQYAPFYELNLFRLEGDYLVILLGICIGCIVAKTNIHVCVVGTNVPT